MSERQSKRREHIAWSPIWGKDYTGWSANFLRDNIWRVDRVNDIDDLMQDAFILFIKVKDTYPRIIDPGHFFALYKRAMINKMHDRSCAKRRRSKVEVVLPEEVTEFFIGRIGEAGNAGYVSALLNELPEELQLVVKYLTSPDSDEKTVRRRRGVTPRENLSMRICKKLGLPITMDPVADLKRLLAT